MGRPVSSATLGGMEESVIILDWQPTKADPDKGRWLLDSKDFRLPDGFVTAQSAVMAFKPGGWAANHVHAKREVLLALDGELYLIWRDAAGQRKEQKMTTDHGKLSAFVIRPNVPHLVENRGDSVASLYEWSDGTEAATILTGEESLR